MYFKEAAQFILETMPKKSIVEVGANLQCWLEIEDPKYRDHISLNGLDAQSGALGARREDSNSRLGLFQWIDQYPDIEINILENKAKQPLSQNVGNTNYLSPRETTDYKVTIS